jgi:hypothetical protein
MMGGMLLEAVGVMTLRDLVVRGQLVELCCAECRTRTPLDPAFFLARRGDIELGSLGDTLVCPACGSADIDLRSLVPHEGRSDY